MRILKDSTVSQYGDGELASSGNLEYDILGRSLGGVKRRLCARASVPAAAAARPRGRDAVSRALSIVSILPPAAQQQHPRDKVLYL